MRKFSTIGLISAAAALSFFCATVVHSSDTTGDNTLIVAESR